MDGTATTRCSLPGLVRTPSAHDARFQCLPYRRVLKIPGADFTFGRLPLCGKFTRDPDEQCFERDLRRQIELFELPPELSDRLGSPLCSYDSLPRSIGPELLELVQV